MNFELNVSQKISQTLTSEQLQHLEILQLSSIELENYIYEKALDNPLLTVLEPQLNKLLDYTVTGYDKPSFISTEPKKDFLVNTIAEKESTNQFLFDQVPLQADLCKQEMHILKYLIYNLDENYFLDIDVAYVAELFQVEVKKVLNALYLLQTFEPVGIGAQNALDYLLIQIKKDPSAPPLAMAFVQNHLDKVATLSIKFLSKEYKISIEETKRILTYIRTLKPCPPLSNNAEMDSHIIPDVIVEKVNEEWIIHLQHAYRPKIEVNEEYIALLQSSNNDAAYCQSCLKDILLLTQGIEQRDRTLYSVIRLLLSRQKYFFDFGMTAIKPVRIKDIAETLNLHESTISRAIKNKYIKTPHGTYALRSLFVKGLTNNSGETKSVTYIKRRISELIQYENKSTPLTDQHITANLQKENIHISRRTVAKYREELNIRSSSKRIYLYQS